MSVVDEAYARYELLRGTIERARNAAFNQPTAARNIDAGYVSRGDRAQDAQRKLGTVFDAMQRQADVIGLLDVCTSFEDAFRRRMGTAIGELRKIVERHYTGGAFAGLGGKLLREPRSFESLASIFAAAEGSTTQETRQALDLLREERNRVAHGANLHQPLRITVQQARDLLNGLIDEIW